MAGIATFVLIVTAVSGYLFSDRCIKYKYLLPREDGQRLYLRSLVYGVPFLFLNYLLSAILFWLPKQFTYIPVLLIITPEAKFLLISFGTFFSGLVFADIYNLYIGDKGRREKFFEAMQKNDFERVLCESMKRFEPIVISLDNRKTYVGVVYDGIEPEPASSYLTIIPFLSGYRDKDTLAFSIQSRYTPVLEALEAEKDVQGNKTINTDVIRNYLMVFPKDHIISIHLYNDHLYDHVQNQLSTHNP